MPAQFFAAEKLKSQKKLKTPIIVLRNSKVMLDKRFNYVRSYVCFQILLDGKFLVEQQHLYDFQI